MNRITTTVALLTALLFGSVASAQTTVELRDYATVAAGSPVRLDQVADITPAGPDADRLGAIVVLATPAGVSTTLSRDNIKSALDSAKVSWARTLLRGGEISLTISAAPAAAPQEVKDSRGSTQINADKPVPSDPRPSAFIRGSSPSSASNSLRALILRSLADAAGIDPSGDAIILRTDALPAADQQLIAQPVPSTWKLRIQVLGATPSGRTPVRIEAYESDRVALARTITLDVLVQREILVVATTGGLARDQVITATDLRHDNRTIPVNESSRLAAVMPEALIGAVVKRRIDQGKPIGPADVAPLKAAIVVKRGDDVTVSCISGGMILKTKAKAMAPARDGELVTLQIEGQKKTFTARMNGEGKAVMSLDAQ